MIFILYTVTSPLALMAEKKRKRGVDEPLNPISSRSPFSTGRYGKSKVEDCPIIVASKSNDPKFKCGRRQK